MSKYRIATAALKRRAVADCYRRIAEGTAMPSDVKTAVADAKRNWKHLRGIAVHLGITNIDEISAADFDLLVDRADMVVIANAVWYRDFIVKHNS